MTLKYQSVKQGWKIAFLKSHPDLPGANELIVSCQPDKTTRYSVMYHIVFEPLSFWNLYILVGDNNVTSKWNEVFFISNIAVSSPTFPFYTPYGNWQTFTARLQHDGSGHEGVAVLLPVLLSFDSKTRSWWRQMETFSTLLAICVGNSPGTGEFPTRRPVTRSFGIFFDLLLNKRLSKQWWGWWFETTSCSLWRHRNVTRQPHLHDLTPINFISSRFYIWTKQQ